MILQSARKQVSARILISTRPSDVSSDVSPSWLSIYPRHLETNIISAMDDLNEFCGFELCSSCLRYSRIL
ncbi:hypothetical protein L1987_78883 [Smallanthus sonchifolius]|uniref:Uncharacterized protein n=1 Tax=Smallanthus sonchifolius TaxID=185202 RepID=A0ACB8ZEY7_9ASTR|nr:hypothetical protein L1987_78883 [Smallanthus sonchifolius]